MCRGTENTFRHHAERFYWYPSTKREQDFRFGQHHVVPFLLAANTVQVLSAFQTLVCLIHPNPLYRCSAFPFGIAFKVPFLKAPSFSAVFHPHAGNKTAFFAADSLLSGFPFGLLAIFFVLAKPLSYQRPCFFRGANKNLSAKKSLESSFVSDRFHTRSFCLSL